MRTANDILSAFLNTPDMRRDITAVGNRMFPDAVPQQNGIGMTIPSERQKPYAERIFGDASQWDDKTKEAVKNYFKNKDVKINDVRDRALLELAGMLSSSWAVPEIMGMSRLISPRIIAAIPDKAEKAADTLSTIIKNKQLGEVGRPVITSNTGAGRHFGGQR
jgi:hypothetical protein